MDDRLPVCCCRRRLRTGPACRRLRTHTRRLTLYTHTVHHPGTAKAAKAARAAAFAAAAPVAGKPKPMFAGKPVPTPAPEDPDAPLIVSGIYVCMC